MPAVTLREWLESEPYSLALSAGFFGFFAHLGVVSVLEREGLAPRRLYGASAGALVAGLWGAGLSTERLRSELFSLQRSEFWDPWPGPGLLRGRRFRQKLDGLIADAHFEECRTPIAISVFDVGARRTCVLRNGALAPAIQASCALPVMFHPVRIDGRTYSDGGILDRPGLQGAVEGERVFYHHLASRSPWHRPGSPALQVPSRANTTTLLIQGLTRVHPFALERGQKAFAQAARAMADALSKPVERSLLRVGAA
jgi:NTE family protein